jgi:hypothetical protein
MEVFMDGQRPGLAPPSRQAAVVLALALAVALPLAAQGIPARLTDAQFWGLVSGFSEEDGFFQSDNFVSNEVTYQHVIPDLVRSRAPGGVYLGVGPDQNFTYIVALQPRIAFIVDIRRGAVLQHLMYKAIIELSGERADYLSMLFSRPRPPSLRANASPDDLVTALSAVAPDSGLYWRNLAAIRERLTRHHGFTLSPDDLAGIEYVYASFYLAGPDITYNYGTGRGGMGRGMPTFGQLVVETDAAGVNRGYLASEEHYGILRAMQRNNLIVPVVGKFEGPRALRAIAGWLRERGATLSAVYTSNVEQYLFRDADAWRRYYENIAAMPLDSSSTFIRAAFSGMGFRPANVYGPRSVSMLCPIADHLRAFRAGRILSYEDVLCALR